MDVIDIADQVVSRRLLSCSDISSQSALHWCPLQVYWPRYNLKKIRKGITLWILQIYPDGERASIM